MKHRQLLEIQEIQDLIPTFRYALVYQWSSVYVGSARGFDAALMESEIREGRFFDDQHELHLFRTASGLKAVLTEEEPNDEIITASYLCIPSFCEEITVKQTLCKDADGQMYICSTRLCDMKGGTGNV